MVRLRLLTRRIVSTLIDLTSNCCLGMILLWLFLASISYLIYPLLTIPFSGIRAAARNVQDYFKDHTANPTLFEPFLYGDFYLTVLLLFPSLFFIILYTSPRGLGKRWLCLEIRNREEEQASPRQVRIRESVKWLWLFPGLAILAGLLFANSEAFLKDILVSSIRFPFVFLFPVGWLLFIGTMGRFSIHDFACGTSVRFAEQKISPGFLIIAVILSILALGVAFVLSVVAMNAPNWGDWDGTFDQPYVEPVSLGPYDGQPRFVIPMIVYTVPVFAFTYFNFRERKRNEAVRKDPQGEVGKEG